MFTEPTEVHLQGPVIQTSDCRIQVVIYLGSVKGGCNGRSKVIPLITRKVPTPSFILIQLISHNLGINKTLDLINNIECDLLRLNVILPDLKIIWSEILHRRYLHYASEGR